MAKSKSFFGMRRGSTKSLTFQVVNGQQVTKERVSEVKNPKTSSQSVQRMKLAPAQKFYGAFEGVLNHAYQGVAYGNKSREHFMSLAMKQNGGPYVVKGYTGLVPGTYLVAEGNIPEVTLTPDWSAQDVTTSLNLPADLTIDANRANFVAAMLANNPWLVEGDKLTWLCCFDANEIYYPVKYQIVLKPVLSEGETDDYETLDDVLYVSEKKLAFALDDAPFATEYSFLSAVALIVSRGTSQSKDERSNARMYVSDSIIARFYSTEAYEIAVASYSNDSNNPLGDEWYLNNFPVGEIGRVAARTVVVDGHSWQILELIITEAGLNKHYILVNGQYCVLPSGARAPFQPSAAGLDGIPTAPWSPSYLTLFSGFNTPGADNFAAAQAARALGCELSDLKVTNVPNITVHNGSATLTAEVAVAFNGRSYAEGNPCVVLTLTQEGQTFPAHAYVDGGRVYNLDDLNFGKPIANCDLSVLNVAATIAADDQSFAGFPYASSGPRPRPVPPAPETSLQTAEFLLGGTPKVYMVKVNNLADKYTFALALSPTATEFVAISGIGDENGDAFPRSDYQPEADWGFQLEEWRNALGGQATTFSIPAADMTALNGYPVIGVVTLDQSIEDLYPKPSGATAVDQLLMAFGITLEQFNATYGGGENRRLFPINGHIVASVSDHFVVTIGASQNSDVRSQIEDMGVNSSMIDTGFVIQLDANSALLCEDCPANTIGSVVMAEGAAIDETKVQAIAEAMDYTYAQIIIYDSSLANIPLEDY